MGQHRMNRRLPLISAVIPVFRSEDILARAIGSLLAQDVRDWEAIIVDDGSPESSWRIIQAYAWIDPRILVIRRNHEGVCATRNAGVAEAQGEYLLFLDADDWLELDAMSRLASSCESERCVAVHGRFRYTLPDGSPTEWTGGHSLATPPFEALSRSNVLSVPSSVLVRKSVLNEIGSFDQSLAHCGDWDLWGRLARHDGAIGHVDQIVTQYRMRPGSLSRSPRTLLRDAITVLRRIHLPDPRVRRPGARFAAGAGAEQLGRNIAHFAVYAAGLAVASGQPALVDAVLDLVPRWTALSPTAVGEFVFYALCFAHCRGPERAAEFWPGVASAVKHLLLELERCSHTVGLADEATQAIDCCGGGALSELASAPESVAGVDFPSMTGLAHGHDTLSHDMLRVLAQRGGTA